MTDVNAIEATGLTKSYGAARVLDGIDLEVPRASVFALLGPNGAGKTTTVRILATLVDPDSGRARVAGHDVVTERHAVRRRISLTGQYAALDELQTGIENLEMVGRLLAMSAREARRRATELIERFDLADAGRRRVGTYSGGMRRRLDLAASLTGRPQVLFLDEPTTGLDPRSRAAMWDVVAELTEAGVTVFLTTQNLEEADRLADRIAVLDEGCLVAEGSADELKQQVAGSRLDLRIVDAESFDRLGEYLGARALLLDRVSLTVGVASDGAAGHVLGLLDELDPDRLTVQRFSLHSATLDDVFMTLTGHHTPLTQREPAHV
jgi:ABC-2 type transport system ATP-binding protein